MVKGNTNRKRKVLRFENFHLDIKVGCILKLYTHDTTDVTPENYDFRAKKRTNFLLSSAILIFSRCRVQERLNEYHPTREKGHGCDVLLGITSTLLQKSV